MSAIAIIPARGGSKRIPRKNIIPIEGKPMLAYPIQSALQSNLFDRVIVSTDDAEIKDIAISYGAEINDRPAELATDTAFEVDVYKQVLESLSEKPEFFCGIYPTAIFIEASDLQNSFSSMQTPPEPDALMAVSRYSIHPYKALQENADGYWTMVYPQECLMRSQTYPDYVASNGTFYWLRTEAFLQKPSYYQTKLRTYTLPAHKGLDIDEPEDLESAKAFMRLRKDRQP